MDEAEDSPVPVGLICGGGMIPALVAAAAAGAGRRPVAICLAGECEPAALAPHEAHVLRWGEVGRLFRILRDGECQEIAFVGSVSRRPAFRDVGLDARGASLAPRLLTAFGRGDDALLRTIAAILAERGLELVSPLALAPDLTLFEGHVAGPKPGRRSAADIAAAREAARTLGKLDIGQAAVAVNGRVVALEGAEGTDGLLTRVAELKRAGRVREEGGVLVKCMKPRQDPRLDIPTIGANTAELVAAAGLDGVAVEAGRCMMAGRDETIAAFKERQLFLSGIAPPAPGTDGG